jgi:hypothetical protein
MNPKTTHSVTPLKYLGWDAKTWQRVFEMYELEHGVCLGFDFEKLKGGCQETHAHAMRARDYWKEYYSFI